MNKKFTSKDSQTDWERITAMQDNDIDLSDIPEVTEEQMARAKTRIAGKSVAKGKVRYGSTFSLMLKLSPISRQKPVGGVIKLLLMRR
jgi:hypothetical protein